MGPDNRGASLKYFLHDFQAFLIWASSPYSDILFCLILKS